MKFNCIKVGERQSQAVMISYGDFYARQHVGNDVKLLVHFKTFIYLSIGMWLE